MGLCIMFAMQSCSSESEPMMVEPNEVNTEISHMVVKFEDKIYETDVKTVGDSVQYLNADYAEVFDTEISKIKDVATLLYTDETGVSYVEYFHSEKELVEKYKFGEIQKDEVQLNTRGKEIDLKLPNDNSTLLAKAELYDDKDYGYPVLYSYLSNINGISVPSLKDLGFNDKTSSIKIMNKMDPRMDYTIY